MIAYVNLIRAALAAAVLLHLLRRERGKWTRAAFALAATFALWLFYPLDVRITAPIALLYPSVVFMAAYLGSGLKFYDRFTWWDRAVHFLSGIMFVSMGVSLAAKAPGVGVGGALAFSASLSLALGSLWEVLEYLSDRFLRTDHQRWQSRTGDIIHQPPGAAQPAGLNDTMTDTIAAMLGTIAACAAWWVALI